ncbi:MAG: large subunit ribosomal protein L5 [Parcubacteria group bacterium Gr01-1014_38]|nr:MAG: large subunit ribosomal protein L5 [Parcubacteria group bacterium Gr01-1014_38]
MTKHPHSFRELYQSVAVPRLQDELKRSNLHALPRIRAVVVAAGTGKHQAEGKFLEDATQGLTLLTGQKPAPRPARKSIAGFKVRAGQTVGLLATLRGRRMEDFLARLLWVALPRVRDFRGIPLRAVDAQGNLTIGFRDASAFPEVDLAKIETPFGLQVTIVTDARHRDKGLALFHALGFPLSETAGSGEAPTPKARRRPLSSPA